MKKKNTGTRNKRGPDIQKEWSEPVILKDSLR